MDSNPSPVFVCFVSRPIQPPHQQMSRPQQSGVKRPSVEECLWGVLTIHRDR
jgi:hypothetical protein